MYFACCKCNLSQFYALGVLAVLHWASLSGSLKGIQPLWMSGWSTVHFHRCLRTKSCDTVQHVGQCTDIPVRRSQDHYSTSIPHTLLCENKEYNTTISKMRPAPQNKHATLKPGHPWGSTRYNGTASHNCCRFSMQSVTDWSSHHNNCKLLEKNLMRINGVGLQQLTELLNLSQAWLNHNIRFQASGLFYF